MRGVAPPIFTDSIDAGRLEPTTKASTDSVSSIKAIKLLSISSKNSLQLLSVTPVMRKSEKILEHTPKQESGRQRGRGSTQAKKGKAGGKLLRETEVFTRC